MQLRYLALCFGIASLVAVGCRPRAEQVSESDAATAKPQALAPSANRVGTQPARPPRRSLRPVGLPHAVQAGMGLGPIMFGATVPTIERHMGMKCEELTETRCRIITAGVEFELAKGVVSEIRIHRFDRPVDGDKAKLWGVFAGGIPPHVLMAMVPEAVIEGLGKPKKSEEVKDENPNSTVRRDYYDGMILEYDLNKDTERLMLGGVRIVKK